jgi:hypothetical protein
MSYNGHKTRNMWNISLWINNDEGLYNLARQAVRTRTRAEAAEYMLEVLPERTPDGVKYTKTGIMAALVGL